MIAQVRSQEPDMLHPALCRHCQHLHDAGRELTVQRYADCSVWKCPRCRTLIDDRPQSWGGSLTGQEALDAASSFLSRPLWV